MATETLGRREAEREWTLDIPVRGMSCASCVGRVEKAIRAAEGVEAATVNLATERARVSLKPGVKDATAVAEAIRKIGYEPVEESINLQVGGMTCASCVGRVEKALKAVPGVVGASVNLATERASVRVLGGRAMSGSLVAAVQRAGYEAREVQTGAEQTDHERAGREAELSSLRRGLTVAAIATLPLLAFEMGMHLFEGVHHFLAGTLGEENVRFLSTLR